MTRQRKCIMYDFKTTERKWQKQWEEHPIITDTKEDKGKNRAQKKHAV